MKGEKVFLLALLAIQTVISRENACNSRCIGCHQKKCMACFQSTFDNQRRCVKSDELVENCEITFLRAEIPICVQCKEGYHLDTKDYECKKTEKVILDCLDMVKIDDVIFCNTCQKGFPSEEYAFTACNQFSSNEVVGSQFVSFTKPPKSFLEFIALKESYLKKFGLTTPSYSSVKPIFACLEGSVNSEAIPVCSRCSQGYMVQNGRCVFSKSLGCLMYDAQNGKCWLCDAYSGYFGHHNDGHCEKTVTKID